MHTFHNTQYQSLRQLGQQLANVIHPEMIASTIAAHLAESFGANRVEIWAFDHDHDDNILLALHEIGLDDVENRTNTNTLTTQYHFSQSIHYMGIEIGKFDLSRPSTLGNLSSSEREEAERFAEQIGTAIQMVIQFYEVIKNREQIVMAREEERRALRRKLHNTIGPTMAALDLHASALNALVKKTLRATDTPDDPSHKEIVTNIDELRSQIKEVIADVRTVIYDLRPPVLDELGLIAAIHEQCLQFSHSTLKVAFTPPSQTFILPAAVEVAAYKIVIEALSNVARHSLATKADINIKMDGNYLYIEVLDNGKGIAKQQRAGVGMSSMRELATQIGGTVSLMPEEGGGTRVTAILPVIAI
jgi:signal transduction histidine kinase